MHKISHPTAAFFDLLRHQRDAGAAARRAGEHPSACRHDYGTPEQRNSFEAAQVFKATTRFVVVDS